MTDAHRPSQTLLVLAILLLAAAVVFHGVSGMMAARDKAAAPGGPTLTGAQARVLALLDGVQSETAMENLAYLAREGALEDTNLPARVSPPPPADTPDPAPQGPGVSIAVASGLFQAYVRGQSSDWYEQLERLLRDGVCGPPDHPSLSDGIPGPIDADCFAQALHTENRQCFLKDLAQVAPGLLAEMVTDPRVNMNHVAMVVMDCGEDQGDLPFDALPQDAPTE